MLEKQCTQDLKHRRKAIENGRNPMGNFLGRAFILQPIWYLSAGISELPNEGEGLHCPLPHFPDMDHIHQGHDSLPVKFLLHFANYFFPLFSTKGGRSLPVEMSGSLSRSQLAAIHYVTEFIQSRYYNDGFSLPLPFSLSLSLPASILFLHFISAICIIIIGTRVCLKTGHSFLKFGLAMSTGRGVSSNWLPMLSSALSTNLNTVCNFYITMILHYTVVSRVSGPWALKCTL